MNKQHISVWIEKSKKFCLNQIKVLAFPIIAVVIALVIGGIMMAIIGINPFFAYSKMWQGIASTPSQIGITLVKTTPLLLTALGLGLAFRSGVFNIGGEGQIYLGALFGTVVAIQDWGLPLAVHLPLSLFSGFVGGGLWAALPGYLKARFRVNEVITTILLNYIAIFIVRYFTSGPLREDKISEAAMPHTAEVMISSRLPIIWQGTRLHLGFVIAIIAAIIMYFVIFRTSFGFKARAVGHSPKAASYSGMKVIPIMVSAMFISGGLAGLAGTIEVLGVQRRLRDQFSMGTGFTAIAIALLGRNHPIGIILAALLFGALEAGVNNMEALAGVPSTIVQIIQAIIIFLVALSVVWQVDTVRVWLKSYLIKHK